MQKKQKNTAHRVPKNSPVGGAAARLIINAPQGQHMFDRAVLVWKAPEYRHHEKSLLWYLIAVVILAALVVYGILTDGWTFSLALIVFAGTYYVSQRETPQIVDVKISEMGVKIGRHVFPFSYIKGFWIVYEPPFLNSLYLRMSSRVHPDICVSIETIDPSEVRTVLHARTKELPIQHEPFADTLVRIFHL